MLYYHIFTQNFTFVTLLRIILLQMKCHSILNVHYCQLNVKYVNIFLLSEQYECVNDSCKQGICFENIMTYVMIRLYLESKAQF